MDANAISIASFISERKNDLKYLLSYHIPTVSVGLKRKRVERARYRGKSFKPFKFSRKTSQRIMLSRKAGKEPKLNRVKRRRDLFRRNFCKDGKNYLINHVWHSRHMFMKWIGNSSYPVRNRQKGFKAADRDFKKGCIAYDDSHVTFIEIKISVHRCAELFTSFLDGRCAFLQMLANTANGTLSFGCEYELLFYEQDSFPAGGLGPGKVWLLPISESAKRISCWIQLDPLLVEPLLQQFNEVMAEHDGWLQEIAIENHGSAHFGKYSISGRKAVEKVAQLLSCTSSNDTKGAYMLQLLGHHRLNQIWSHGRMLTVELNDPRYQKSGFESASAAVSAAGKVSLRWPADGAVASRLWDPAYCMQASKQFESDFTILHRGSVQKTTEYNSRLEPSTGKAMASTDSDVHTVPVLFVRQLKSVHTVIDGNSADELQIPPQKLSALYQGWDLIFPRVHSKVIWTHLQKLGLQAVGREEWEYVRRSVWVLSFPRDYPDTPCGRAFWEQEHRERQERNSRRPPQKQVGLVSMSQLLGQLLGNFEYRHEADENADDEALGDGAEIKEEGGADAEMHVKDATAEEKNNTVTDFLVVRGDYLNDFRLSLRVMEEDDGEQARDDAAELSGGGGGRIEPLPSLSKLTLVYVTVTPTARGQVRDLTALYMPRHEDYELWLKHKLLKEKRQRSRKLSKKMSKLGNKDKVNAESLNFKGLIDKEWAADEEAEVKGEERQLGDAWQGLESAKYKKQLPHLLPNESPASRILIGFVLSGQKPRVNKAGCPCVVAVVDAEQLHSMQKYAFETFRHNEADRLLHPQVHKLVMFHNAWSSYMRPGLIEFL